ncbi:hypothetical protein VP01_457g14 [Puccinia sorghi]|uniref:Uncharacterized protein n=1 Tax=Puccinia sorghi TaxID=27349 RepID=A0A0L6UQM5_9BASI|nr:hypothetical protein VP01_457g14 [Puccinia sorghi]
MSTQLVQQAFKICNTLSSLPNSLKPYSLPIKPYTLPRELPACHQARAIDLLADGSNVIVTTSTLTLESIQSSCGLYIFPTKALAQDQKRLLLEELILSYGKPLLRVVRVETYDGDAPGGSGWYPKKYVIFTNPDMLRLTKNSGAATAINPQERTSSPCLVFYKDVKLEGGAPTGAKNHVVWNLPLADNRDSAQVRTIVFCRIRKTCELLMKQVQEVLVESGRREMKSQVRSHWAGYTTQERRLTEAEMFDHGPGAGGRYWRAGCGDWSGLPAFAVGDDSTGGTGGSMQ